MKKVVFYIIVLISGLTFSADIIDLSGQWSFSLDPQDEGVTAQWFRNNLSDSINLPGTTDDAGFGKPLDKKAELTKEILHNIWRKNEYIGTAWYQKEIVIPENYAGKRIELSLERVLWDTKVWLDGVYCGNEDSLVAPQVFYLPEKMRAGKHRLTLRIDNRKKYEIGNMAHAHSGETQIVWNGVIGKLQLRAIEDIEIGDVQVYPDVNAMQAVVKVQVCNNREMAKCNLSITAFQENATISLPTQRFSFDAKGYKTYSFTYNMKNAKLWSEFEPNLYNLQVSLKAENLESVVSDEKNVRFGMREFTALGKEFMLNDTPVFLRGTLECCIFPKTGYPPMEKPEWERIMTIAKDYGLNHLRFHSWCPPEAAFEVADEMGFYFQVELPLWAFDIGQNPERDNFIEKEADRILAKYGNHPSFCLLSIGNELNGEYRYINNLVEKLKTMDSRHLYTCTTFTFQYPHGRWPEPADDYYITQSTLKGWVRGQGFFNERYPSTTFDFRESLVGIDVPVISHEIGQYAIYPNMQEIEKYTGVTTPLNLIAVRNDLTEKGMLSQANEFFKASGKLSAILYKEDIEMCLRTPGIRGFQLLDLHDFPGQSTALIGLLDAFWDSKGAITPGEFRQFSSAAVPLLRMPKRVFENDELFECEAEICNFTGNAIEKAKARWEIKDESGERLFSGRFNQRDIPLGKVNQLGIIKVDLSKITTAQKLVASVYIPKTDIYNSWDFWVYPVADAKRWPDNVIISDTFDSEIEDALDAGKTVVLLPNAKQLKNPIKGMFVPVFWSPVHFPNQPGTMGILCNPDHPAFADFPTDYYTNWQWWEPIKSSVCIAMPQTDSDFKPILQPIDNFARNNKLASIFEAKVSSGKLLFCSVDIQSNLAKRPVARQLRNSLIEYVGSDKFAPKAEFTKGYIAELFAEKGQFDKATASCNTFEKQYSAECAIDNNSSTMWHSSWSSPVAKPHYLQVQFDKQRTFTGFTALPRQDGNVNGMIKGYEFWVSNNANDWKLIKSGTFKNSAKINKVQFDNPAKAVYIKFVAISSYGDDKLTSLAEFGLLL